MSLQVGDLAPDFTLDTDVPGETFTLSHFRGQKVLLYFYPKDSTPGCTQEACDFRDSFTRLQQHNVIVAGISKDSTKTHAKFKEKYQLPFPLLVDDQADVCEAYGVVNKKSMFGKTFLGISRSTFLIDEKGKLQGIWRGVKVKGHVEQILNELK